MPNMFDYYPLSGNICQDLSLRGETPVLAELLHININMPNMFDYYPLSGNIRQDWSLRGETPVLAELLHININSSMEYCCVFALIKLFIINSPAFIFHTETFISFNG